MMKLVCAIMVLTGSLALAKTAVADTVILGNGDHLTGTVGSSDGKELTLKTDYAGEIKVHWSAVKDVTSARPLYVKLPDARPGGAEPVARVPA